MEYVIGGIAGIVVGGVIAWLIAQARMAHARGQLDAREQGAKQMEERIVQMNARIDQLTQSMGAEQARAAAAEERASRVEQLEKDKKAANEALTASKELVAKLNETISKERESWDEQKKLIEEAKARFTDAFKVLSADALEDFRTKAKTDLLAREESIQTLVNPLQAALKKYEEDIRAIESKRDQSYGSLDKGVKDLGSQTLKIATLLSSSQARGKWGEFKLERLLEVAGLEEGRDFSKQRAVRAANGESLILDVTVNLPDSRYIIVDAKTPFEAYMRACETSDEERKKQELVEHSKQVKKAVDDLNAKEYWSKCPMAIDLVVMFIPGEHLLGAALEADPGLLEYALGKHVVLGSPANLMAMLLTVAHAWREAKVADNANEIKELGSQLYDRLIIMWNHYEDLRKSLNQSVSVYNKVRACLNSRVLVTARKLRELGVTAKSDLTELQPSEGECSEMLPVSYEIQEPDSSPALPS